MGWLPKAKRHVHYRKSVSGTVRMKPATITNVDSATQLDLRIGHHTTIANAPKCVAASSVDCWLPY